MVNPSVYLAGPIAGCNKSEANDWRKYVAEHLSKQNITGISPLRCEPIIGRRYKVIYDDPKFGSALAIRNKNTFDVKKCDLTLAYLPADISAKRPSYGTVWEIGAANILGKPVIIVTDDKYIASHPLLGGSANWLLDDLDEAIDVCIGLLAGYNGGKNV